MQSLYVIFNQMDILQYVFRLKQISFLMTNLPILQYMLYLLLVTANYIGLCFLEQIFGKQFNMYIYMYMHIW